MSDFALVRSENLSANAAACIIQWLEPVQGTRSMASQAGLMAQLASRRLTRIKAQNSMLHWIPQHPVASTQARVLTAEYQGFQG